MSVSHAEKHSLNPIMTSGLGSCNPRVLFYLQLFLFFNCRIRKHYMSINCHCQPGSVAGPLMETTGRQEFVEGLKLGSFLPGVLNKSSISIGRKKSVISILLPQATFKGPLQPSHGRYTQFNPIPPTLGGLQFVTIYPMGLFAKGTLKKNFKFREQYGLISVLQSTGTTSRSWLQPRVGQSRVAYHQAGTTSRMAKPPVGTT